MADLSETGAVRSPHRRPPAGSARAPERPPLGPSGEPKLRDLAVYTLWLTGVALIVASLFL